MDRINYCNTFYNMDESTWCEGYYKEGRKHGEFIYYGFGNKDIYSKNKLITEQKLFKQLNRRLLILRISNVIGDKEKIKKYYI